MVAIDPLEPASICVPGVEAAVSRLSCACRMVRHEMGMDRIGTIAWAPEDAVEGPAAPNARCCRTNHRQKADIVPRTAHDIGAAHGSTGSEKVPAERRGGAC